jgi:PAS domain S-box-containing protein
MKRSPEDFGDPEASLRMLWRAVEQSGNTFIVTDRKGDILYVNPRFEELTGYSRGEVIGENPRLLQSGGTASETYAEMWRTISGGEVWKGELLNRRKNGEVYWGRLTVAPVKGPGGEITNYIGIEEDVTRLKDFENQLKESNTALRRTNEELKLFTAMVSHDVRAPIATVMTALELLKERNAKVFDHDSTRLMDAMTHKMWSLHNLVEDLLGYSRMELVELHREAVDLQEILEVAQLHLEEFIEEKGARIVASKLPIISVDRTMLTLLFQNLIQNGIKYNTSKLPEVSISCTDLGDRVRLEFNDNGIGMSDDDIGRLFVPFCRLASGHSFEGTGLGLAICKRVVARHRGTIEVSSVPGAGTTFIVTLPKSAGNEDLSSESTRPKANRANDPGLR